MSEAFSTIPYNSLIFGKTALNVAIVVGVASMKDVPQIAVILVQI